MKIAARQRLVGNGIDGSLDPRRVLPLLNEAMQLDQLMRDFAAAENETLVCACQNGVFVGFAHMPGFAVAIIILRGAKTSHGALVVVSRMQTGQLPGSADLDIFSAVTGNGLLRVIQVVRMLPNVAFEPMTALFWQGKKLMEAVVAEPFLRNIVSRVRHAEAGAAIPSRLCTERQARLTAGTSTLTTTSGSLEPPRTRTALHRSLLHSGMLVSHYQPVIDVQSRKIMSVEALARLAHDKLLILPGAFLPSFTAADRHRLFRSMMESAFIQLKLWSAEGVDLTVSVNVDPDTLMLNTTLPMVVALLQEHHIEPQRLTLEILETKDFSNLGEAAKILSRIRQAGIKLALDDVGAGYSSMLKVRQLPLDIIKLDRAFLVTSQDQPDGLAFIRLHQALASDLGLELIVEGVETIEMLDTLNTLGIDQAQGYGICRPMSGPALLQWLKDGGGPSSDTT